MPFVLLQRNSISPAEREKYRARSPPEPELKKVKKEEKDGHASDGEKSDQDLVVDDQSEDPVSPHNGTTSPRENGIDKVKKDHIGPHRYVFPNRQCNQRLGIFMVVKKISLHLSTELIIIILSLIKQRT